jgi:putative aldouronate transport system permease protein
MAENGVMRMGRQARARRRIFTPTNITLYLMFLPILVYFILFHYVPMAGILIAFTDYRISGFKAWVGFENFRFLFNLPFFWQSFLNTWRVVLLHYLFAFPAPIILALLLNEVRLRVFKAGVQTLTTIPYFISWVVIAGIFTTILSPSTGYVNDIIKFFGGKPFFFFSKPALFPFLFTAIDIWKVAGYSAIIYLAALAGINPELYESAVIDGAGRFRQTISITLPGLRMTILVVLVLSFSGVLNLFEPIYVLKNNMVLNTAEVIDTYTYTMGIVQARYPLATAVGLFKSTISLALVLLVNLASKYLNEERTSIL